MDFKSRIESTSNQVNKRLFQIMEKKRTNLCLALDLNQTADIFHLMDKFGPHIVAVKIHVVMIEDFNYKQFTSNLNHLKEKHDFLIFEDFKFADIGATNLQLYVGGMFRIQDWADLITAHVFTGLSSIEALMQGAKENGDPRGCLLVSQMSNAGNIVNCGEISRSIATKFPQFVSGFISQSTISNDPGLIQFTPGVNIGSVGDHLGQQYITPEEAVLKRGADIIIVGRGIINSDNQLDKLLQFKERGYSAYLEKIKQII